MAKPKPLYIDAEGIRRGYYVYLHRQRSVGTIFYVGKGHGGRAWEKTRRHKKWLEKTAALGDDWEVVIVRDDLSETEAFAAEEELCTQHGGAACDGGPLINRVPGGENPVSVSISVDIGDTLGRWLEAYASFRKFKDLPRKNQEEFIQLLVNNLRPSVTAIEQLEENDPSEAVSDCISDLDCIMGTVIDSGKDFLKRRISWQDFAIGLEEAIDDLQPTDIAQMHRAVRPLARKAANVLLAALAEIDSGNREDAEAAVSQNDMRKT